ncbi:glycosyltransferase family 4 protein [Microbacterium sp. NPDC056052]|uniref:glycosyltransferase family 4 protein n=1 Tax=Microbacterium sp. NPDC056052 TaxID=3345695 RepID=UPI0035DD7324
MSLTSPSPGRQPVAISCAFDENAIRAIALGAHRHDVLTRRAIRDQAPLLNLARGAGRLLPGSRVIRSFVAKQSARVGDSATPEDIRLSTTSEFLRVFGGRVRTPLTHTLGNATWKVVFDNAARHIDFGDARTLISMPGSSLGTFERNRYRRLVLHEIDAHPRVRNERLEAFYGARRAAAETYPRWFVERIEAELELADSVLVPGKVVAGQMRNNGISEKKIIQVPYGVDPTVFRPPSIRPTERRRRLRLVCTAQICLRKGTPFLLDAVRDMPVDLTLVGQVFDRRIMTDLPDNVTHAGVLTAAQIADLYARSDAFVLPTIEDCFALVVAEAAAAGLPVITTFENGAHELLGAEHQVIDAGDVAQLRHAIDALDLLSWDQRTTNADRARDGAATTWSEYADTVLHRIGALS